MFFDAKEFHTSNKQVANILSSNQAQNQEGEIKPAQKALNVDNANWGDDDDLDIDADNILEENSNLVQEEINVDHETAASESSDIFVPPS